MENRPTKTIITPFGKAEVVMKEWLIGSEVEHIEEAMYDMVSGGSGTDGSPQIKADNVSKQIIEGNHRTITAVIVSIDGSAENILDKVLGMRHEDYSFIMAELEKVTNPKKKVK
jgi:hypothetical protein